MSQRDSVVDFAGKRKTNFGKKNLFWTERDFHMLSLWCVVARCGKGESIGNAVMQKPSHPMSDVCTTKGWGGFRRVFLQSLRVNSCKGSTYKKTWSCYAWQIYAKVFFLGQNSTGGWRNFSHKPFGPHFGRVHKVLDLRIPWQKSWISSWVCVLIIFRQWHCSVTMRRFFLPLWRSFDVSDLGFCSSGADAGDKRSAWHRKKSNSLNWDRWE